MENSEIFIEGLGISGYRSFGPDIQRMGPFNKINLFIGQNNSGKSNILRFLKERYNQAVSCDKIPLSGEDLHIGKESLTIIELGMTIDGEKYSELLKKHEGTPQKRPIIKEWIEKVLNSKALTKGTRVAWFRHEKSKGSKAIIAPQIVEDILSENVIEAQNWQELWHHITKQSRGELKAHWIPEILQMLSPFPEQPPGVALIPAFREVKGGNRHVDDHSGTGLIVSLFKLQNPSPSMYGKDKAQFEAINEFLRTVLVNPTAKLEIPHDMKTITVIIDDKPLSLSSVGAGIHEVIILAAWATVLQNQIICIEEPEIHFHPLLQKHFVRYLSENTNNQYFIATHSAHILDTPDAEVFHVRLVDGQSIVETASTDSAKSRICDDLGYRASDLLQANCVIWVEGPSDRTYINHWIQAVDENLTEGLHYSIMFYGGRLLSHLTAEDQEVTDFISLRRLNRHIAIIMDSDQSGPRKHINATKTRVRDEFGLAWITKGREIENYVETQILEEAVRKVCPKAVPLKHTGQHDKCLKYSDKDGKVHTVDKVKVAKEVSKVPPNLNVLDLKVMVENVVQFIRSSNDID